jgi:DNA-directed RNA polymerase subunit K/omega
MGDEHDEPMPEEALTLTKYEETQLIALRAALLDGGASPCLTREELDGESDPIAIAIKELRMRRIDAKIVRDMHGKQVEVPVQECSLP